MATSSIAGWSSATAFCADSTGSIYAVTISGEILVGAVKSSETLHDSAPAITRVIHPRPALDFVVTHAAASPSGQFLALAGFHEGREEAALALVQLRTASKQTPELKCRVSYLDQQTFWEKPGLKFHQLQWHPYSPNHLAVLTSDLRFRLYNVHHQVQAEQTFHLQVNSRPSSYGLPDPAGLQQVTSFCFGPPTSWGFFTVFFITSTGEMYCLCPVAPFGMMCPAPPCDHLPSTFPAATSQLWLQMALGSEGLAQALPGEPMKVRPHTCEMTGALQGPLNEAALNEEPAAHLRGTCRVAAGHYANYDAAGEYSESPGRGKRVRALEASVSSPTVFCSAFLAVDSRGQACGYLMTNECIPAWVEIPGESKEDAHGRVISVSHSCGRVPAAGSQMELLDLMDLGLEGTRGENLLAAPRRQGAGQQQLGWAGGEEGDDEDEEGDDDVYLQLLASSQELPGQFWLGHLSGVWLITLPWLRVVAEAYTAPIPGSCPPSPPPSLPQITEHCLSTSSSRSIVGIALLDLNGPLLSGGQSSSTSCLCASLDVERGVRLHWPMMALPDNTGARLQTWGLQKAEELDKTVEAQHERLAAGIGKVTLPPAPTSSSREQILKYLVDSTACLTRHYSPYCQTAHDDLNHRALQLYEETYSQSDKAASLAADLKLRHERQLMIEARVKELRENLQGVVARVASMLDAHTSAPRPLAPQEKQVIDEVLPNLKAQTKQLEASWHRLQPRVDATLNQPPSSTNTPSQLAHHPRSGISAPGFGSTPRVSAANTPAYGSMGISPAGPNSIVSAGPGSTGGGNVPESQAAKLFQQLGVNNRRLAEARRKLDDMQVRLQEYQRTKNAEEIALKLRPLAERDDDE